MNYLDSPIRAKTLGFVSLPKSTNRLSYHGQDLLMGHQDYHH